MKMIKRALLPALALAIGLPLAACGHNIPPTWQDNYVPVRADVARVQHDLAAGKTSDLWDAGDQLSADATDVQANAQDYGQAPHGPAATSFIAALGYYADAGNLLSPGWVWDPTEVGPARANLARGNAAMARVRVLLAKQGA